MSYDGHEFKKILPAMRKWGAWERAYLPLLEDRQSGDDEAARLKKLEEWADKLGPGMREGLRKELASRINVDRSRIEYELGAETFSTPKGNLVVGGSMQDWSAGVAAAPDGWTSNAAAGMTLSRVAAAGTSRMGNYGCRVQTGAGAEGGIENVMQLFPGRLHTLALRMYLTSGSASVRVTTDGATPLAFQRDLAAATYGADAWFGAPTTEVDLRFRLPADATTATLKLYGLVSSDVRFCDVQIGQGSARYFEIFEANARDDAGTAASASGSYTPTGTAVLNVTTITPGVTTYFRVGDQVHLQGTFSVDPVAAGATTFRLSLPPAFPSNFGAVTDGGGGCVNAQVPLAGEVASVVATDDLLVTINSPDGTQRTFQYWVDYRVI